MVDRRSRGRRLKRLGPSAFSSSAFFINREAHKPVKYPPKQLLLRIESLLDVWSSLDIWLSLGLSELLDTRARRGDAPQGRALSIIFEEPLSSSPWLAEGVEFAGFDDEGSMSEGFRESRNLS